MNQYPLTLITCKTNDMTLKETNGKTLNTQMPYPIKSKYWKKYKITIEEASNRNTYTNFLMKLIKSGCNSKYTFSNWL